MKWPRVIERMLGLTERSRDVETRVILERAEADDDARLVRLTGVPRSELPTLARRAALRYSAAQASERLGGR